MFNLKKRVPHMHWVQIGLVLLFELLYSPYSCRRQYAVDERTHLPFALKTSLGVNVLRPACFHGKSLRTPRTVRAANLTEWPKLNP